MQKAKARLELQRTRAAYRVSLQRNPLKLEDGRRWKAMTGDWKAKVGDGTQW